jgi:hypothetical protein
MRIIVLANPRDSANGTSRGATTILARAGDLEEEFDSIAGWVFITPP